MDFSIWRRRAPIPGAILHTFRPLAQAAHHDVGRKMPGIFHAPGHFLRLFDFRGLDLHTIDSQFPFHWDYDAVAAIDLSNFRSSGLIRFHLDGHGRSL